MKNILRKALKKIIQIKSRIELKSNIWKIVYDVTDIYDSINSRVEGFWRKISEWHYVRYWLSNKTSIFDEKMNTTKEQQIINWVLHKLNLKN